MTPDTKQQLLPLRFTPLMVYRLVHIRVASRTPHFFTGVLFAGGGSIRNRSEHASAGDQKKFPGSNTRAWGRDTAPSYPARAISPYLACFELFSRYSAERPLMKYDAPMSL